MIRFVFTLFTQLFPELPAIIIGLSPLRISNEESSSGCDNNINLTCWIYLLTGSSKWKSNQILSEETIGMRKGNNSRWRMGSQKGEKKKGPGERREKNHVNRRRTTKRDQGEEQKGRLVSWSAFSPSADTATNWVSVGRESGKWTVVLETLAPVVVIERISWEVLVPVTLTILGLFFLS